MTTTYRPGQLYKGADGDLLFTVITDAGIGFVTNRGTPLTREHVEEVYAPLTLVRPVGGEATVPSSEDVRELAAALRDALDVPTPYEDDMQHRYVLTGRAAYLCGVFGNFAKQDAPSLTATTRSVLKTAAYHPITYTPYVSDTTGRTGARREAAAR